MHTTLLSKISIYQDTKSSRYSSTRNKILKLMFVKLTLPCYDHHESILSQDLIVWFRVLISSKSHQHNLKFSNEACSLYVLKVLSNILNSFFCFWHYKVLHVQMLFTHQTQVVTHVPSYYLFFLLHEYKRSIFVTIHIHHMVLWKWYQLPAS